MNILTQLHGRAKTFMHYEHLFTEFDKADKPFMLVKTMATPRRDRLVPRQAEFFDTREELDIAYYKYYRKEVRENGLDVMFVDCFEWDLGINHILQPELN